VTYTIEGDLDGVEYRLKDLLRDAQGMGVVSEYGACSTLVWFQGPPGDALRALRRLVMGMCPRGVSRAPGSV